MSEVDRIFEEVKKELDEFEIEGLRLSELFEPVLEACRRAAKNKSEFIRCVTEAIDTLRQSLRAASTKK